MRDAVVLLRHIRAITNNRRQKDLKEVFYRIPLKTRERTLVLRIFSMRTPVYSPLRVIGLALAITLYFQPSLTHALELLEVGSDPFFPLRSVSSGFEPYNRALQDAQIQNVASRDVHNATWSVQAGAAILTRGTLNGSPVVIETDPTFGNVLQNANQFRFNHSAGPDLALTRSLRPDRYFDAIGFRYFDVQSIAAASNVDFSSATGFGMGKDGFMPTSTTGFDTITATYASSLYSFEANLHRQIGESNVAILHGFRWIQANDSMGVEALSTPFPINWAWNTNNNLYGYQIGGFALLLPAKSRWNFTISPKVGIYGNQCDSRFLFTTSGGGYLPNRIFQNRLAFAGDLSANLSWNLWKHVSFQAGYQLLWLNGVAVAADQASVLSRPTDATGLNSSGSAFYHGALIGLNSHW